MKRIVRVSGCMMLAATIVLAGCGRDVVAPADAPLRLALSVNAAGPPAQGMTFSVQVTNVSDAPVAQDLYTTRHDAVFSPIVTGGDGEAVWTPPDFTGFFDTVQQGVIIPPGGTASFATTWDLHDTAGQRVAPGTYFVTGRLLDDAGQVTLESGAVAVTVF